VITSFLSLVFVNKKWLTGCISAWVQNTTDPFPFLHNETESVQCGITRAGQYFHIATVSH